MKPNAAETLARSSAWLDALAEAIESGACQPQRQELLALARIFDEAGRPAEAARVRRWLTSPKEVA